METDRRGDIHPQSFSELLHTYRLAAGLTQEELAERAGMSARNISNMERGTAHRPRKDTLRLLITALHLTAQEAEAFVAWARAMPGTPKAAASAASTFASPSAASPPVRAVADTETGPTRETSSHSSAHHDHAHAPCNIPEPRTPLIGREREVATAVDLLTRPDVRLLTLEGPPGVGKTRLAIAVAAAPQTISHFADGIYFVELEALTFPDLLPHTIAQVLDLQASPTLPTLHTMRTGNPQSLSSLPEQLKWHLRTKHILLVLDNCEHLLLGTPLIGDLLSGCGHLKVLATSRAALRLYGEQEFHVAPLALPGAAQLSALIPPTASTSIPAQPAQAATPTVLAALDALSQVPAVTLMLDRVRRVQSSFTLTTHNAATIAAICTAVDGLPLAIELAAARVKILPPATLLARLESHRLAVLTSGSRDLPPRQQTLRATLAWSYDLLAPAEQRLFRRLAVFTGGATLEALEAIEALETVEQPIIDATQDTHAAGTAGTRAIEGGEPSIMESLSGLVDQGLVERVDSARGVTRTRSSDRDRLGGEATRFRMLATIREYAADLLQASGEHEQTEQAYAAYFMALAEMAEPHLRGAAQREWLERLYTEHDNLSAALAYALDHGKVEIGLRIAAALRWHWITRGYSGEGREWLHQLLAADAETPAPSGPVARTETAAPEFTPATPPTAATPITTAARFTPTHPAVRARALHVAGVLAYEQSDYGQAVAFYEESLALRRALGDEQGVAMMLNNLGIIAAQRDEYPRAISLYEESLALRRALGDQRGQASVLTGLGVVAHLQGDYVQARRHHMRSLWIKRELGDLLGKAVSLHNLGAGELQQGNYARARALCERSLALARELQVTLSIASPLDTLGRIACAQGDLTSARALLQESLEYYEITHSTWGLAEAYASQGYLACLLGDSESARRWYRRSLRRYHTIEMQRGIAGSLEGLAWAAFDLGAGSVDKGLEWVEWGVQLWAAADALRQRICCPMPPQECPLHERAQRQARATLGVLRFEAAWKRGQSARLDDLVRLALQWRQDQREHHLRDDDHRESMLEA